MRVRLAIPPSWCFYSEARDVRSFVSNQMDNKNGIKPASEGPYKGRAISKEKSGSCAAASRAMTARFRNTQRAHENALVETLPHARRAQRMRSPAIFSCNFNSTLSPTLSDEHGTRSLPAMCYFAAVRASHHLYLVLQMLLWSAALAE